MGNAIIWLVKQEGACQTVLHQYQLLLREFNNAAPPIILVVNGQENYEDQEEREANLKKDRQRGYEFGLQCAHAAGISVSKIIVSTTKPDLKAAADDIYYSLALSQAKKSALKSYAELKEEISSLKTASEKVQYEIKKINEEKEFASTIRSIAWKTWWVPIAG